MEDAYSWLVPGVQIVERGRKIDEEKKEGKLERGKGREPLKVPSPSSQSPLVFPPLVFLACDFTCSTPSENRTLCTI